MKKDPSKLIDFQITSTVFEQDFFDSICNDELCKLILFFQQAKRENFKTHVLYLEFIAEATSLEMMEKLDKEKNLYWNKYLHYDQLETWSLRELNKRNILRSTLRK
jgi:hypothetical protein